MGTLRPYSRVKLAIPLLLATGFLVLTASQALYAFAPGREGQLLDRYLPQDAGLIYVWSQALVAIYALPAVLLLLGFARMVRANRGAKSLLD